MVTGEHKRRVEAALRVLERWKRDLPDGSRKQLENINVENLNFKKADSPPSIVLPMPPTSFKVQRHPTPPPPTPKPAADEFRTLVQYPDGFESEDWDIFDDI